MLRKLEKKRKVQDYTPQRGEKKRGGGGEGGEKKEGKEETKDSWKLSNCGRQQQLWVHICYASFSMCFSLTGCVTLCRISYVWLLIQSHFLFEPFTTIICGAQMFGRMADDGLHFPCNLTVGVTSEIRLPAQSWWSGAKRGRMERPAVLLSNGHRDKRTTGGGGIVEGGRKSS